MPGVGEQDELTKEGTYEKWCAQARCEILENGETVVRGKHHVMRNANRAGELLHTVLRSFVRIASALKSLQDVLSRVVEEDIVALSLHADANEEAMPRTEILNG